MLDQVYLHPACRTAHTYDRFRVLQSRPIQPNESGVEDTYMYMHLPPSLPPSLKEC